MNKTIDYYNENAEKFIEGTINVDFSFMQNKFMSYLDNGAIILDLGCGSGRDSKVFSDNGFNVISVDGSKTICEIASKYLGKSVICSTFEDYNSDIKFGGIWACASLLHSEKSEIKNLLIKYSSMLSNNGVFYLSFKYGTKEEFRNGRFFSDFKEDELNRIIECSSLKIEEEFITEDVRPDRTEKWINVFASKRI